jgi:hypothetical protein
MFYVPIHSALTLNRKKSGLSANLVVGFQPFLNISYTSHVTLIGRSSFITRIVLLPDRVADPNPKDPYSISDAFIKQVSI